MKQTINESQFHQAFHNMGRGEQFSYDALGLIYNYLEELDENTELDVIALCCEIEESDYSDVFNTYPIDCDIENPTEEDIKETVMGYLYDNTSVIGETEKTVVFVQF
jgi:hypothetical protein